MTIFNSKSISFMSKETADYNAISDQEIVQAHEFARYVTNLGPNAVKFEAGPLDINLC